jgi:hypothetical protein
LQVEAMKARLATNPVIGIAPVDAAAARCPAARQPSRKPADR